MNQEETHHRAILGLVDARQLFYARVGFQPSDLTVSELQDWLIHTETQSGLPPLLEIRIHYLMEKDRQRKLGNLQY